MSKLNEVIDSLTNENVDEVKEKLTSEANAQDKANSQLYSRAKKAEGFEYNKDGKKWIKKEVKPEVKPEIKPEVKEAGSNEPDYSKLAFLRTKGVKHPDDQKLVQDEADRLKLPLTDVLGMKHIISELKDTRDQREAGDGMPKGRGKAGGVAKDVDYHLAKGTTPDDLETAEKVINARTKKEEQGNKFSDDLYTG